MPPEQGSSDTPVKGAQVSSSISLLGRLSTLIRSARRPIAVGSLSSTLVLASFLALAGLAEGSLTRAIGVVKGDLYVVSAVVASVGVSMGIRSYARRRASSKASRCSMVGSGTSIVSMFACCLHHFTDTLASISVALGTSASLLIQYRGELVALGIGLNSLGTALMLRPIISSRRATAT